MSDGCGAGPGRGAAPLPAHPGGAVPPAPCDARVDPALARRRMLLLAPLVLAACAQGGGDRAASARIGQNGLYPNETPYLRSRTNHWAQTYDIPSSLIQRVVLQESQHQPGKRNGPYYGLMQLHPTTARTMGYRGHPAGLLDADTNLQYGAKYLRGAYLVAEGDSEAAISWYRRGYYYEARRKGLLRVTGLRG